MIYEYQDLVTGKTLSVEQRITADAYSHVSAKDGSWLHDQSGKLSARLWHPVKRLISGAPAVQFISGPSGGWSQSGYALTPAQRKAEHKLGRRVTKRA